MCVAKYIVTGGAGFIGSNLVHDLAKEGHEIVVVDPLHTGSRELIKDVSVEFYQMAFHEFYRTGKWKDMDGLYHLGKPSASPMYRESRERFLEGINGSIAALEMIRETGVKMVSASTSSVYNGLEPPHREGVVIDPTDFYTEARVFEERNAKIYEEFYGVKWNEMRFFSIYGPREQFKKNFANLVTQFLWAAKRGEQPVIYGNGEQKRDFVYVNDVVDALEKAMASSHNGIYNVGTGKSHSINEMLRMLEKRLNVDIKPKYIENPMKNYVMVTLANTEKAKRDLEFEAKVSLRDGIGRIDEYYSNQK
jgi:UDP-glucose 4-epimerase